MSLFTRATAVLSLTLLLPMAALAAGEKAQPLLFESRQLDLIDKGAEVTYRFEKTGSDERLVGKNYADDIRVKAARAMSLDDYLEFLAEDELLEVTPTSLRIRKRVLDNERRMKDQKAREKIMASME